MNYIKERKILELKENFRIPIYQRQYAWGKDEIEQLLIDLKQFQESNKTNYFLGNIVVTENGGFLDVIDGQQRLTTLYLLLKYLRKDSFKLNYEIREEEKQFLFKFDIKNPHPTFKEAIETIQNLKPNDKILDNVIVTITSIPKEIDVVKYFEVMNNRGKQLEKHQIIKAKFLEILKDEKDYNYAKIWDYCSQMNNTIDNIIYYNDIGYNEKTENKITDIRKDLLNNVYQKYFKSLEDNKNDFKSINDLLNENTTQKELTSTKEYKSIIKFPIFLIHALKTFLAKEKKNFEYIKTNDRYLIEYFTENNKLIFDTDKAKNFLLHLLKLRILFDYFIIKRDENDNPIIIGEENKDKNLLMLELLFNFTSPQYFAQDWISVVLAYLDKNSSLDIDFLEIFDKKLAKIRLLETGIIEFINEKIKNIYGENNTNILISEEDISNKLENILNKGTSTPHYWFYKLDYLLWKDYDFTQKFKNSFDNLVYAKIKDNFRLTRLNSIEHIFPQSKKENFDCNKCQKCKDKCIDCFGNLTLISNHMNSALIDKDFENKKLKIQEQLNNGTIESLKLLLVYSKYEEWNEENCKEHYEEILTLLESNLK